MPASGRASRPMDAFTIHGGRLSEARRRFPDAPAPWIDLSTGINPEPYPVRAATREERSRLPDPAEIAVLEAAAAQACGVEAPSVLATAGAEAGIRLLAAALPARRVGILEPAYGGHAEAWRAAGVEVKPIARASLSGAAACDLVVAVNPNNPDGALLSAASLRELAWRMKACGGWLVVDEAFIEASEVVSATAQLEPDQRLITLRSFGKFYGLPGLRLGFLTAPPDLVDHLRARLGAWPVSADAIAAGCQAYADQAWAARTRERLAGAAARLDRLLISARLDVVGGTNLFRLAAAKDAPHRFHRLAQAGVLTRPFDYAPNWLRFGLPADEHWPRLQAALMESAQ